MDKADFSTKPILPGEKVTLEPVTADHFDDLWKIMQDPVVTRLTGTQGVSDLAQAREWTATRADTDDRIDLVVIDNETGACVGEAVLNDWSELNRSCGFRILIGPTGRDRGLGTEATRLTVGYAFETLLMHRVELEVFAFNPRAQRVYEKVGFVVEGRLRHQLNWDGDWIDAIRMSILEDEWARHRGYPKA